MFLFFGRCSVANLEMHETDRDTLNRLLQIPMRMLTIPEKVCDLYFKAQRAHSHINPGNLPYDVLMCICLIADAIDLPKPTPTKFGHLKEGHPLFFKANDWEWVPCTFIKVQNDLTHIYLVHLYGEDHPVAEKDLRLEHPSDVPVEPPAAVTRSSGQPDSSVAVVTQASEETKASDDKAASIALVDRLKIAWPIGKAVDVAKPGEAFWSGTIKAHGGGQFAGRMQVLPLGETTRYKWVSVDDITEAEVAQTQPA